MGTPSVSTELRLRFTRPLCPDNLFGHLVATAVPGVEEWRDGAYRRTLRLPHGPGIAAVRPPAPGACHLYVRLDLSDRADRAAAIAQLRWCLDLDADPGAVDAALATDPSLRPAVQAAPGRRVPRSVDGAELAVRAVLGQQVSTAAARTHTARLVRAHGGPVIDPGGGLTHLFPTPAALQRLDPDALAIPAARRETLRAVVAALASGRLDLRPGAPLARARAALGELPGVGPWTVEMVAMRALGDPDAFPGADLGVRQAARSFGLPGTPVALAARSAAWRPWRAYAVQHLWATGTHAINRLPTAV